jgi:ApbE superfamily uncharacterized protein (UPF0280 family)
MGRTRKPRDLPRVGAGTTIGPMTFEPRTYRRSVEPAGLVTFEVVVRETDLQIAARTDLTDQAAELALTAREQIEDFIAHHPIFGETYAPFEVPDDAPPIVREMARAASLASVGPMAAVAGAIAEHVARGLSAHSDEVIVENGGDIYMLGETDRTLRLHAGPSPMSDRVGIVVPGSLMPVAVCTSSATVGPSVSLGRADAACVVARGGALADAVASALGNRVHSPSDVRPAIEAVKGISGVLGLVIVVGETLGAWGKARLIALEG